MTIRIDVPASVADQLRAQFQPHSAKSLINAKDPDFLISYHLANSVSSAKQLSEAYDRLNQPVHDLSDRFDEVIRKSQVMANRSDAITAPIVAEQRRLERSIAEIAKPIHVAAVAAQAPFPRPPARFGGGPPPPSAPLVRATSKAARIVNFALQRLRDRRRRDADARHRVELIVDLPLGGTAIVTEISATEDGLIRVCGIDVEEIARECFIAPEAIQYEIAVVTMPPPGAQLTVVE